MKRPDGWKHGFFWGELHGWIPAALLSQVPRAANLSEGHPLVAMRAALLLAGFACLFFSLLVPGPTVKLLMRFLGIGGGANPV